MYQPSGLVPTGGEPVNRAGSVLFQWTFNGDGNQSAFDLRWRPVGDTQWRSISVTTNQEQHELSDLPHGEIEWQVRTYNEAGEVSPWSAVAVFFAGDKPETPTIIRPSEDVNVATPTVEWSSRGQVRYRLVIGDNYYTHEGTFGNSHIVQKDLENNQTYIVRLSIQNEDGLWSDEDTVTITVSFSTTVIPYIEAEQTDGSVFLNVNNVNLEGTFEFGSEYEYDPEAGFGDIDQTIGGYFGTVLQHTATHYDVFRNNTRIAKGVPLDVAYQDYPVGENEYILRVRSDDGYYTDSEPKLVNVKLKRIWLQDIFDDDSLHQFKFFELGRTKNNEQQGSLMEFEGRSLPLAQFTGRKQKSINVTLQILDEKDMDALRDLIERQTTLLYRDYKGRRMHCVLFTMQETEEPWGYVVPLTLQAVYVDEEV